MLVTHSMEEAEYSPPIHLNIHQLIQDCSSTQ